MATKIETGRGVAVLDNANITVTNSTAETSLLSSVIQAKKMGNNKAMRFTIITKVSTAVSLVPTLTIKVKLGSSVLTVVNSTVLGVALTDVPIAITGMIVNQSATNSQFVYVEVQQNNTAARSASADWTVDTTVDQTFSVTAQFGGLSLGTSITSKLGFIELT